jgi:hypothetical protein
MVFREVSLLASCVGCSISMTDDAVGGDDGGVDGADGVDENS